MPSETVNVPADFSIVTTLRGYKNFEDVYQGVSHSQLIYLSDRESGKDPESEEAYNRLSAELAANGGVVPPGGLTSNASGISPWLQRGIPVPLGGWIVLYLPYILSSEGGSALLYYIGWRNRSVEHFRETREPFHLAFDGLGQDDDGSLKEAQAVGGAPTAIFGGATAVRRLITGYWEPTRWAPTTEPATGPTIFDDFQSVIRMNPQGTAGPLTPTPLFPYLDPTKNPVSGDVMQGFLKNAPPGSNQLAYLPVPIRCKGDELILAVRCETDANYDFNSSDFLISLLFGRAGYTTGQPTLAAPLVPIPTLGAYMSTGSAP